MEFWKMEGLGNDYIYVDCMEGRPADLPGLARSLSERHFGVGGDGLIALCPGRTGDISMEMYNADGSRGAMCGNGIRCLAKLAWDLGAVRSREMVVDTDAGPRRAELVAVGAQVSQVRVDMGGAEVFPEVEAQTGGACYRLAPVRVGNCHGVCFCADPWAVQLEQAGPRLERHPALPWPANIGFAACGKAGELSVRVWELGSGATLACGTGACAAFAAARARGLCPGEVQAHLPGGTLALEERAGRVWMTGPARLVFRGQVDPFALLWGQSGKRSGKCG